MTLPGVGRKTANVVLGNAFGVPGITTDTHVMRLSLRLGYTTSEDPLVVEQELGALLPRKDWTMASHRLIFHGRRTCFARKPACGACPVAAMCPSAGIGEIDPVKAAAMVKAAVTGGDLAQPGQEQVGDASGASSAEVVPGLRQQLELVARGHQRRGVLGRGAARDAGRSPSRPPCTCRTGTGRVLSSSVAW